MKEAEYHKRQMDWDKEDYPRLNAMALQIRKWSQWNESSRESKKDSSF